MNKKEPTQLWLKEGATVVDNGRDYVIVAWRTSTLFWREKLVPAKRSC
jgi:hypothetical protein